MKRYFKKISYWILVFIFLIFLFWNKITLYIETTNSINTKTSTSTVVTPVLDTRIESDKNLIYCSTAQMAWNSLHDDIIKETIEIENQPWYVEKLNALTGLPPQISSDAYVAMAGFDKDNIVVKIKTELSKKFGVVPNIKIPVVSTDEILAFSYLKKVLDFKKKFGTFYSDMTFNNKLTTVKAFGFRGLRNGGGGGIKGQVKVLALTENKEFILELVTLSSSDSVILSTVKPEDTMLNTYNKIVSLMKASKIHPNITKQTVVIPKINFNIEHIFGDLNDKKIKNPKFNKYCIKNFLQFIKFKLNENGARIESYASVFSMRQTGDPLSLEVEGPFTLLFKDKNAKYPYFMTYFGNDELLEKKQSPLELLTQLMFSYN